MPVHTVQLMYWNSLFGWTPFGVFNQVNDSSVLSAVNHGELKKRAMNPSRCFRGLPASIVGRFASATSDGHL